MRRVLLLASGTALGQAAAILCMPVWTRFYSPDQIGVFGVFMACAAFCTVAVTLRYELSIPNAANDSDADALLLLSILVCLPSSLLLSGMMLFLIKLDVISLGRLPLWSALALVPVLFITGLFCSLRYWLVRKNNFQIIGKVLAVQGSVRGLVPIPLGFLHFDWTGLLIGEIGGRAVGVHGMLSRALPQLREHLCRHGLKAALRAGRDHLSFPAIVLPASLLDLLALSLPVPLIAYYYGTSAAGVFFVAQRLTSLPVSFIGASVADVFHSALAQRFHNHPAEVKPLLMRGMGQLLKFGLVTLGPLAILAPLMCGRILGSQYSKAGSLIAVLTPWCLAQLISSPLSRLLVVANRTTLLLWFDVLSLGSVLLGFGMGNASGIAFLPCVALVSALQTLSYAVYAIFLVKVADGCRNSTGAHSLPTTN